MITGVRTIRTVVPAASMRAERSPPRRMFGVATSVADATARRSRRYSFTARDPARRHAQLAHADLDQPQRHFGVARRAPRRRRPSGRGARAAATTEAISSSTGSRTASSSCASAGFPRSAATCIARGRWCRSRRSRGAARAHRPASAAAGTSIIAPTSIAAVVADPSARGVEQPARRHDLGDGGDHREHHGDGVLGRHAQDRAQLRREEVRVREREAQSAATEERVRLGLGAR